MRSKRLIGENPALSETQGVPLDGYQDPTGTYPRTEYRNNNSINRAATGTKIHKLKLSGDVGVNLDVPEPKPSVYPHSQVKETSSGHVIEYDDTPGSERILIKHRTGAGVEMRGDGSVIISATNNRIEVTGGDQTTIIEGNGTLIYKGNLDLKVQGDMNVDVAGDYNLNVTGNYNQNVIMDKVTTVGGDTEYVTKGCMSEKTVEHKSELVLGNKDKNVKGYFKTNVEGNINEHTDAQMIKSAKELMSHTSQNVNVSAVDLSIIGVKGIIGGDKIEFTGPVYYGPGGKKTGDESKAAFYGSFYGQASEALIADKADQANKAGTAAIGAAGEGATITLSMTPYDLAKPQPKSELVGSVLTQGDYAVQAVSIDAGDHLRNKILLRDDYLEIFKKVPTTQEIRSAMRDTSIRNEIAPKMVAEGKLNPQYANPVPKKVGRTSPKTASSRFGYNPVGNSLTNRGRKFTV
jgi:hypothetical protein